MRVTGRLPKGSIIGGKYIIEERLTPDDEEKDLRYTAFDSENTEKYVLVRELVFSGMDEKFVKGVIEPLLLRLLDLTSIGHPNLVPIYQVYSEEDKALSKYRVYIVTDISIKDIKTLAEVIKDTSEEIPLEQIKDWSLQICDGLEVLHNFEGEPIIYYDLSPENIMITEEGTVKLYDYGCTRMLADGFYNNRYMGTAGYSAPEQYGLKPIDGRADIFGLGALMHYLITGKDPKENPLNFSKINKSSCPKRLSKLVSHCLDNNIENRLQKIEEVRDRLDKVTPSALSPSIAIKKKEKIEIAKPQFKEDTFIKRTIASISWSLNKIWYKHAKQITAIGALLVLTLIVVAILSFASSNQEGAAKIMIIGANSSDMISMDTESNILEVIKTKFKNQGKSVLSRDGKYIYTLSNPDHLFCFDLEQNEVVSDIKVGKKPEGMAFSPVQNYLAVPASGDNTVTIVDTEFDKVLATLKSGGENPVAVCFSSKGDEIFVLNKDSQDITAMELTGSITAVIDTEGTPVDIINTGVDNKIYVSLWDKNEILIIDEVDHSVISRIPVGEGPSAMVSTPSPDMIALMCVKSKEVILISVRLEKIVNRTTFEDTPSSIAFSEDGEKLYVGTSNFDNSASNIYLWNIDGKTKEKVASPKSSIMSLVLYK